MTARIPALSWNSRPPYYKNFWFRFFISLQSRQVISSIIYFFTGSFLKHRNQSTQRTFSSFVSTRSLVPPQEFSGGMITSSLPQTVPWQAGIYMLIRLSCADKLPSRGTCRRLPLIRWPHWRNCLLRGVRNRSRKCSAADPACAESPPRRRHRRCPADHQ